MTSLSHKFAFVFVAALVTVAATVNPADAQNNFQNRTKTLRPLIDPGFNPQPHIPKFGFASSNIGIGERVSHVHWGGLASQIGLERGDIILSMNGFPLNYTGSWTDALHDAVHNGGVVRLRIRDVRSGQVVVRQVFVGDNGAPEEHYYKSNGNDNNFRSPNGPVTWRSTNGPNRGGSAPLPIIR